MGPKFLQLFPRYFGSSKISKNFLGIIKVKESIQPYFEMVYRTHRGRSTPMIVPIYGRNKLTASSYSARCDEIDAAPSHRYLTYRSQYTFLWPANDDLKSYVYQCWI